MSQQFDLFDTSASKENGMPEGFRLWSDALTELRQQTIVKLLEGLPFAPYEFQGYKGKRRVVSFGLKWNQVDRRVEEAPPLPSFLIDLRSQLSQVTGHPPDKFAQALVNEYQPGAGIGWHRDRRAWGEILGLSLLEHCTFRLRRENGPKWERASVGLEPGSLYLLSGDARRGWEHSIVPMQKLRYSVTFRTRA